MIQSELAENRPYPGLRPFNENETDIYFGREKHIDEMLIRLKEKSFLSVIGSSGCGKSSLVKAGMIPALRTRFIKAKGVGSRWEIVEIRPGNNPLQKLANSLSELYTESWGSGKEEAFGFIFATLKRGPLGLIEMMRETQLEDDFNFLLIVDQFEEIFRYSRVTDEDEADAFVALLLETYKANELPLYVTITMRSDFLGDCAIFPGLPEAINKGQFLTPNLNRDECRDAIVSPALVYGGDIEDSLVTTY